MLFAEPLDFLSILPWIVVAIAVGVLVFIVVKCVSIYRNLKRNKACAKNDGESVPLLAVRGDFFVLACGVEYVVGDSGQLKQGKYVLRGDGYDEFQVKLNGEEKVLNGSDVVELSNGDTLSAVTCNTLIRPHQEGEQQDAQA